MHTSLGRHSVDNEQRIIIIKRTYTTDSDGSRAARITIGCDIHTGNSTLKCLYRVVFILLRELVHIHNAHRARKVSLALNSVSGHHDFVEILRIRIQGHQDTGLGRYSDSLVSDSRYGDLGAWSNADTEVTIDIGNGTVAEIICLIDCSTYDRAASIRRNDLSGNSGHLSRYNSRPCNQKSQGKNKSHYQFHFVN